MKSIVFIETNKHGSSIEGIRAAKNLGYYIHLITSSKQFEDNGFPEVDEIHFTSVVEEEVIYKKIMEINKVKDIDIIISFIDSYVSLAAKMNNKFCKQTISEEAYRVMEDKILTRKHFQSFSYSPYFFIYNRNDSLKKLLSQFKQLYPLILKSPSSSGSKDVYLIHSENQMKNRIHYLINYNLEEELLIEEFLEGPQVIVEAFVYQGNIEIVAIIEQEITKHFKFIVTGYSISSDIDESMYESITNVARSILNDLGVKNGNCHLELRLVKGNWKLIEINPRISGGAMNRLIYEAYGFNYVKQLLKLHQGYHPLIERKYGYCIYAHFFTVDFIGKLLTVTGMEKARKNQGIIDVFIKPKEGQILSPPLSMGHRYGYIIAKGKTKEEAKLNALQASEHIKFHLSPISH